jgi:hypothetical protein
MKTEKILPQRFLQRHFLLFPLCDNAEKGITDFKMNDITLESFHADVVQLDAERRDITAKEQMVTPLRDERDHLALKLNEVCARAIKRKHPQHKTKFSAS